MTSFLFDDLARTFSNLPRSSNYSMRSKEYAQYSTEQGYSVEVPAIGVKKEDINVTVEQGVLTVSTKPSVDSRYSKEFTCSWSLPETVDPETVSAKLEHGLLTVSLAKAKLPNKKVNVTVV